MKKHLPLQVLFAVYQLRVLLLQPLADGLYEALGGHADGRDALSKPYEVLGHDAVA